MSTHRPNPSSATEFSPNGSAQASTASGPSTLIHFEGDWPYREQLWLQQRVREADRALKRVLGPHPEARSLLHGARWLAQRSALEDGSVRITVHRQGTGRVLVGKNLGQIHRQICRLPILELRPDLA